MQLPLPGVDAPTPRSNRWRPRSEGARSAPPAEDSLLATFLRRLWAQGRARKGRLAYGYQMRSMLLVAARLTGRLTNCGDLWRDAAFLGRVRVDDTAPTLGTRLSRWTLAQRRSAIRAFATLMRPELMTLLGEDPHDRLDRALRSVAERVGAGYRLNGGAPRQRGGPAPSASQVADVLEALGREPGYVGLRNRAFFLILAETGARVNALRELDGSDCVTMPSEQIRIFLHEKGKGEPREVELGQAAADALREFAAAFNYLAAIRRWSVRVCFGERGSVWRNSPRGRWSANDIRETLRAGCAAAEVPPFTPHALRRTFATDAASVLPRHTVARAGGWQGLERLDDHYVQPRRTTIRDKLARADRDAAGRDLPSEVTDEPVTVL